LGNWLNQPETALEAAAKGAFEPELAPARRLALTQRAERLAGMRKNAKKLSERYEELKGNVNWPSLPEETPEEIVQGRLLPKPEAPGAKTVFVAENSRGENVLCSVEEFAKEHYKKLGFTQGVHGEGGVPRSITGLLFWDVIYGGSFSDVFRGPNQASPLDLNSKDFYESRREVIEERLAEVESMQEEELRQEVVHRWNSSFGVISVVHWELFRDGEHAAGLVRCLGGKKTAAICGRILKNHR